LIERFEDPLSLVGADARSVIDHVEDGEFALGRERNDGSRRSAAST
jgi:hypothetical protein